MAYDALRVRCVSIHVVIQPKNIEKVKHKCYDLYWDQRKDTEIVVSLFGVCCFATGFVIYISLVLKSQLLYKHLLT